ncbi:hypothetical protein L1085_003635 [Streptomyces sp. MSC1_001]
MRGSSGCPPTPSGPVSGRPAPAGGPRAPTRRDRAATSRTRRRPSGRAAEISSASTGTSGSLTQRTTVRVDENRSLCAVSTHLVVRALRSGTTGVTVVHGRESRPGRPPGITARFGTVGGARDVPELGGTAVEILFGQKLLKNQTVVVDVEWRVDPVHTASTHYQQAVSAGLRECLLHVVFLPEAVPAACHAYRGVPQPEDAYRSRRILLDASHSVHLLTTRHRGGVHGIGWTWPD